MKTRFSTKSWRFWLLAYVVGALFYSLLYSAFRREFYVHPALLLLGDTKVQMQGRELIDKVETAMELRGLPLEVEVPSLWHVESGTSGPSLSLAYRLRNQKGNADANRIQGHLTLATSDRDLSKTLIRPSDATPGTETFEIDFNLPRFDELLSGRYLGESPDYSGCLYLSAVTISTLGTGDVLPKSNIGRFLIVSEVLYGIIVLGMLLHYVTQGMSSESKRQPKQMPEKQERGQPTPEGN